MQTESNNKNKKENRNQTELFTTYIEDKAKAKNIKAPKKDKT